jgi:hypothetical protein
MTSFIESGKNKIISEAEQYTVNNEFPGPDLVKLLMNKAIIGTRATSTTLLSNLMNLDDYMSTCNCNIELFNQHAKIYYEGLKAHGDVPSFIVYLFKGYKAAADDTFRKYIQSQRGSYDQGESMDQYTLMTRALHNFKTMLEDNEWCAILPQEEHIIALSAQLKQLKDSNLKISKVADPRSFHNAPFKDKDRGKKKTGKGSKRGKHIWAQSAGDNFPWKHGTMCTTNEKEIILIWKQLLYTRIPTQQDFVQVQELSNITYLIQHPFYTPEQNKMSMCAIRAHTRVATRTQHSKMKETQLIFVMQTRIWDQSFESAFNVAKTSTKQVFYVTLLKRSFNLYKIYSKMKMIA